MLKQADCSACMDDGSEAPTCRRWKALIAKMKAEKAPFTLKELAISGRDLLTLDIPARHIATVLEKLLLHTCCNPADNEKQRLLKLAVGFARNL